MPSGSAGADRDLAQAVARDKSMFFAARAADGTAIDYAAAVNGHLQMVPLGESLEALEEDYARMVEDGLLLADADPFEELMARCATLVGWLNDTCL